MVVLLLEERDIFVLNEKLARAWCDKRVYLQLAISSQANLWDCGAQSWGMDQKAVIANSPLAGP